MKIELSYKIPDNVKDEEISPLGLFISYLFKNKISNCNTKINEAFLFRSLCEVFKDANTGNIAKCEVIHGSKSYIYFKEIEGQSFYCACDKGSVKCELADLLLIAVNSKKMRICFLQNKLDKKRKLDDRFLADMRQFYLLKNRPTIEKKGISCDLLKEAKFPSICSYGVFYKNDNFYDMNYYSAGVLEILKKGTFGKKRVIFKDKNIPEFSTIVRPNDEKQFSEGIEAFVTNYENMLIGEEFDLIQGLRTLSDNNITRAVNKVLKLNIADDKTDNTKGIFPLSYKYAVILKGKEIR